MSESCDNGETFQFISDDNASTYAILVAAGSGSLGGPFDLSVTCEPVVYGCMDDMACNYNADANVDDPNDPCDFISCLGCDTETWEYCYDNSESWSFTLVNPNGGTIVVDLAGTLIEQGWDELTIDDAATGANLYNSDVDPDESLVIGTDSLTVSFTSDGSVSCVSSTTGYYISLAITCAPAPTTGCSDETACNYNGPVDFADDSQCDYSCLGCTNSDAVNYDPFASVDDGSCCFGAFIEFNMFDSFGDGWNGATYTFYDADGNAVASGDLLSNENNGGLRHRSDLCGHAGLLHPHRDRRFLAERDLMDDFRRCLQQHRWWNGNMPWVSAPLVRKAARCRSLRTTSLLTASTSRTTISATSRTT